MENVLDPYKSQFAFNGNQEDMLISYGFIYYKNIKNQIQCVDLIEKCVLTPVYAKLISSLNEYQTKVLKFHGFGDYRNVITKTNFKLIVKNNNFSFIRKDNNEMIKFEIIDSKEKYYKYLTTFDLRFSKYQYVNFEYFNKCIKLDFMDIHLITPENMRIFEKKIRESLAIGFASYSRELFVNSKVLSNSEQLLIEMNNAKKYINNIINSRIECSNVDLVDEIINNANNSDGSYTFALKKIIK